MLNFSVQYVQRDVANRNYFARSYKLGKTPQDEQRQISINVKELRESVKTTYV